MEKWIVWSLNTGRIRSYDPEDKICGFINLAIEQSIKAEEERRGMLSPKKTNNSSLNKGGK